MRLLFVRHLCAYCAFNIEKNIAVEGEKIILLFSVSLNKEVRFFMYYFKNSVGTAYIKNSTVFVNARGYMLIMLIHDQTRLIDAEISNL